MANVATGFFMLNIYTMKNKNGKLKDKLGKIGSFLKEKGLSGLGDVMNVVDDVFPPAGIITKIIDIASPDLSPEEHDELVAMNEDYLEELKIHTENTKDARAMYQNTDNEMADLIAGKIIKENLWLLLGLVIVQVLVVMFVEGQIAAVVTGVVGTITGALINERNTVVNFFFGSSKGSKDKDKV